MSSYVHGGAWRDPRSTYAEFEQTIRQIVSSQVQDASPVTSSPASSAASIGIRGFASIDYRLSPHPDYPQPSRDAHKYRGASHPDHAVDVRDALRFLDGRVGISDGDGYVLLGHSAGAMLSMQTLMDSITPSDPSKPVLSSLELPRAIVGTGGIYDLIGLRDRHGEQYDAFIKAAFTRDEKVWKQASPAFFEGSFSSSWAQSKRSQGRKMIVLAWSPEDSLVDEPEIDVMARRLRSENSQGFDLKVVKDLQGDHNDVWKDGFQMVRLINEVLTHLGS